MRGGGAEIERFLAATVLPPCLGIHVDIPLVKTQTGHKCFTCRDLVMHFGRYIKRECVRNAVGTHVTVREKVRGK